MSKLSEISFSEVLEKEYEIRGKKVRLRALRTRDTMDMTIEIGEDAKTNDLLKFAIEMLSKALVSIDGVVPDSPEESREFLLNQEASVVFEILSKYQDMNGVKAEDLKNLEGTPS